MTEEVDIFEGLSVEEAERLKEAAAELSRVVMGHMYMTLGTKSVAGIEMDEVLEAFSMSVSAAIAGLLGEAGRDFGELRERVEKLEPAP